MRKIVKADKLLATSPGFCSAFDLARKGGRRAKEGSAG